MAHARPDQEIEKVDDLTVKFMLNRAGSADARQPRRWTSPRSCRRNMPTSCSAAGTPELLNQQPVGTGPFQFVAYQQDAVIRYKANPDYWGGKQPIDDLVFAITPDAAVRLQKLKAGECDIMPYPNPADIAALKADPNLDGDASRKASTSATSPTTRLRRPSTRPRSARRSTWRSTSRRSSTPSSRAPARCGDEPDPADHVVLQQGRRRTIPTIRRRPRRCSPMPASRT